MEKEELEIGVCENQMTFDFSMLENCEVEEEESSILPEGFVVPKNHDWIDDEVLFVVVKTQGHDNDLCGKTMLEWVKIAGSGCEKLTLADGEDIYAQVRSLNSSKNYIAVFYSDTPLLEKNTFHKIMDYFCKNQMNVLTLPRGYVFKSEFLKNNVCFASGQMTEFENAKRDFICVNNSITFSKVSKYLYDKIRLFHLKNGVIMSGSETIFIDADVEIEAGVSIEANNHIKGQTYIGKGVILEPNNVIKNSIISDNACLCGCYIENSKVTNGKFAVMEKLINQEF